MTAFPLHERFLFIPDAKMALSAETLPESGLFRLFAETRQKVWINASGLSEHRYGSVKRLMLILSVLLPRQLSALMY
jgi:hypothetical protein